MRNELIGKQGENIARNYLTSHNYIILAQNWTCHWGEIDLIALIGKVLVFVEVKYRSTNKFGSAYEAFNRYKQLHLKRSINIYLQMHSQINSNWQLDLICIDKEDQKFVLTHYKKIDFN
ncbi:MAG TPA: YraN family protein [Candidatus Saccharimonadales bacterium]|nr:YraN family protein [Candidatus Saccharimonadales bacterium]